MVKEYRSEISMALFFLTSLVAFYYLYGLLLPFVFGLGLAFASLGIIVKIQKKVRNQALATTLFLIGIIGVFALLIMGFTHNINRDFNRLNESFVTLVSNVDFDSDKAAQKVKDLVGEFYDLDELESMLSSKSDSMVNSLQNFDYSQLDTESIKGSLEPILSFFQGDDAEAEEESRFSWFFIFASSLLYFVLILYQIDYFITIRKKYFNPTLKTKVSILLNDFNTSFVKYFALRSKIVFLLALIYIITFAVLDIPGLILMVALIIFLSYIPYLQYFVLIPLAIGCLTLSIESEHSFLFFFGIVVGAFVLASLLEELVLTPWIMEKNVGMNPVIMVLALSVWGYILGLPGLLIGIPLTSLTIIYFKRFILPASAALQK